MITIFSIPKPFKDPHIANIQTNAILSWKNLGKEVEVILLGNDFHVPEFCQKFNIKHIGNVKSNEEGVPFINSAFSLVRQQAKNDLIMYVNADIILTSQFLKTIDKLPKEKFLAVGQRWDINIDYLIDYTNKDWETDLCNEVETRGLIHPPSGSDYFIFHRNDFEDIPAFAVGRIGWDNWMIENSLMNKIPVIDVSAVFKVIHQNHDYLHKSAFGDKSNIKLLSKNRYVKTLRDANHALLPNGLKKKNNTLNKTKQITLFFLTKTLGSLNLIGNTKKTLAMALKIFRRALHMMVKICGKMIEFVNSPIFYLEQKECEKFKDCVLLSKVLYHQPPNSDRYLEYPWLLNSIKITNGRILDVGSTASNMLYDFLPKEVELNSIDLNDKEIKDDRIKFSVGDIRKTSYKDNYFDVVSCISTLEHIGVSGRYGSEEDSVGDVKAVKEMTRILKPGGVLLMTVPYGIKDILPINKLYNKNRLDKLLKDFSAVEIEYKKYFDKFQLWLTTDESEASKTDMINDRWYAIAFIKATK